MRLFVAIDMPDNIKDYLFELQKEIGNSNAKIRWVAKKNLHLTLKFIGNIADNKLDDIKEKLRKVKYNSFETSLDELGWFPGGNQARVLWIGVKPSNEALELQRIVDASLLDIVKGDQRFSAHLTIGRIKMIKDKQKFFENLKKIRINNLKINANEYCLFRSQPFRDGSRYTILEKYKLG